MPCSLYIMCTHLLVLDRTTFFTPLQATHYSKCKRPSSEAPRLLLGFLLWHVVAAPHSSWRISAGPGRASPQTRGSQGVPGLGELRLPALEPVVLLQANPRIRADFHACTSGKGPPWRRVGFPSPKFGLFAFAADLLGGISLQ